jgi:hypothetical protein
MKEDSNHHPAAWEACVSKMRWLLLIVPALMWSGVSQGQPPCTWNKVFYHGEQTTYDLYFKWGILMPKAGLAHFSVKSAYYDSQYAWEYKLQFNTTGMFDKIFKMRDTLATYFSLDNRILFSDKRTDEGGYYIADRITFSPLPDKTYVHSQRHGRTGGIKIDTSFVVEGCVFDMMAVTMYLRAIEWENLKVKDELPFRVVVGREVINASFRYTGQEIVVPDNLVKYRTHHFYIDVYDPAFEHSKAAAEVWIGDDKNHLPIRVRAKLKIGAAEVYLKNATHLEHPFSCRIPIAQKTSRPAER